MSSKQEDPLSDAQGFIRVALSDQRNPITGQDLDNEGIKRWWTTIEFLQKLHQEGFSPVSALRLLNDTVRILERVGAPQSETLR